MTQDKDEVDLTKSAIYGVLVLKKKKRKVRRKVLNVGCGNKPCNFVNVDLFPYDREQCEVKYDVKSVSNFCLSDGQVLPFQDCCFDAVYCSHTLEHIEAPLKALREFRRVLKNGGYALIVVPSKFYWSFCQTHIYSWNTDTVKALCKRVFSKVWVGYTSKVYGRVGKYGIIINLLSRLLLLRTELLVLCQTQKREFYERL